MAENLQPPGSTGSIVPPAPAAPKSDPVPMMTASCEGGDLEMGRKLARFPSLVHAPEQHGEGIRTHMKGAKVEDIAKSATAAGLYKALDAEATKHGIDLHELCDALRFARQEKMV